VTSTVTDRERPPTEHDAHALRIRVPTHTGVDRNCQQPDRLRAIAEQRDLSHDTPEPMAQGTELLDAAAAVAARLRHRRQAARVLKVTVQLPGGCRTERTRTLPAPTSRVGDLRAATAAVYDALALQHARVCAVAVCAEQLTDTDIPTL
jgi:DNA polymerase-4